MMGAETAIIDRALPGPDFVLCPLLRLRREADERRIAQVKRALGNGSEGER